MSNILKPMNLSDKVKLFPLHDEGQYVWGAYVKVSSSEYVGMIVGKGGSNIIRPSMEYQTRVQNPAENAEPCFIVKGTNLNGVIMMGKWICDKNDALLKHHTSKDTNIIEKRIRCCQKFVSLLVGPKGRTVKDIMNKSNTNIQSPPKSNKPKCFTVSGNTESVDAAILYMQKYIWMYGIANKESELIETCDDCLVYGLRCASLKVMSDPLPHLSTPPRSTTTTSRMPVMPQTPYLPQYDLIPYTQPPTPLSGNPIKDYLDNINNMMAAHSNSNSHQSRPSYSSLSPSYSSLSPSSSHSSSTEELHVRVLEEMSRGKTSSHMNYRESNRSRGPEAQWKKWEEEHFEKMRQDRYTPSYRNSKQSFDPAITKGIEDLLNDTIIEGPAKGDWETLQSYWGC